VRLVSACSNYSDNICYEFIGQSERKDEFK
jgi:hypothetical protein